MSKKILKLICGAGNEDTDEIEKLSYIYAAAGFDMIDTAAKKEAVNAVKSGINKAGRINGPQICASIGLESDIHVSKACIDDKKCTLCGSCIRECPRCALAKNSDKIIINKKRCTGCGKCLRACPCSALILKSGYKAPCEMLKPLLDENIALVEFHCTSEDETLILKTWQEIQSMYKGKLSICLNRSKLGDDNIIKLLKEMIKDRTDIIVQADGRPMTGAGAEDYQSSLQTVSFAQIIQESGINAQIILSGGVNLKTAELAQLCGINPYGYALGSYARKLVKEYTSRSDFWTNDKIRETAVKRAVSIKNTGCQSKTV